MSSRLEQFPLLASLPEGERVLVAAALSETDVAAGTELTRAGDFGWAMYAIEEGEAAVLGRDGSLVARLGPGDVFGEVALVVSGRRAATVIAQSPMRLLSLFTQDFQRMRESVPTFEAALRGVIDERLAAPTAPQPDPGDTSID